MKYDKKLWADSFSDHLPAWPCPTCGVGHLAVAANDIQLRETGPSLAYRQDDAWEPDWIANRFVSFLECSFADCKEVAVVCGTAKFDHWQVGYDEYVSSNIFVVEMVVPPPKPIAIPTATPTPIVDAIDRAAKLIWPSPESAANQIGNEPRRIFERSRL